MGEYPAFIRLCVYLRMYGNNFTITIRHTPMTSDKSYWTCGKGCVVAQFHTRLERGIRGAVNSVGLKTVFQTGIIGRKNEFWNTVRGVLDRMISYTYRHGYSGWSEDAFGRYFSQVFDDFAEQ